MIQQNIPVDAVMKHFLTFQPGKTAGMTLISVLMLRAAPAVESTKGLWQQRCLIGCERNCISQSSGLRVPVKCCFLLTSVRKET